MGDFALGDVIRTADEELRWNFVEMYRQWRHEAERPGSSSRSVDGAWQMYVDAREAWIYGPKRSGGFKPADTSKRWSQYNAGEAS